MNSPYNVFDSGTEFVQLSKNLFQLMKILILYLLIGFTGVLHAQGECQVVYVSDHYVLNNTTQSVTIWVNNRNQESFPTNGPQKYEIEPGARVKVSDLAWAEEFRDPTTWYVFKVNQTGLTRLCDKNNWIFEQLNETKGEYSLILEPTNGPPCEELNEDLYFTNPEKKEQEEKIYDFVDVEASFPGGPEAMIKWIVDNLEYPQVALENNIEGRVFVEFVVEKTGELSNISILRSPNDLFSKEVIRLIGAMPNWEPGKVNNQNVRMRYRLPINFRLD